MERDYIVQLSEAYDRFFAEYDETPLLRVKTDLLNLVRDRDARAHVIGAIRAALAGYEQQPLLT